MGGSTHLSYSMGALMAAGGALAYARKSADQCWGCVACVFWPVFKCIQSHCVTVVSTLGHNGAWVLCDAGKGSKASLVAGCTIGALFAGRFVGHPD
jgi:uncharacterized membrane protein (UPF0136 family)